MLLIYQMYRNDAKSISVLNLHSGEGLISVRDNVSQVRYSAGSTHVAQYVNVV